MTTVLIWSGGSDEHFWPFACSQWLEEKARNRMLEQQLNGNAMYEVEVKTGGLKVCVPCGAHSDSLHDRTQPFFAVAAPALQRMRKTVPSSLPSMSQIWPCQILAETAFCVGKRS